MSEIHGAPSPKGYPTQLDASTTQKVDPKLIDGAKTTFNGMTSSPNLGPMASLGKLFVNLGFSGMRVWNQVDRQQVLLDQHHQGQHEILKGGGDQSDSTKLSTSYDQEKTKITQQMKSEIGSAAYDMAKDVSTIGPIAKKVPGLKVLFAVGEVGSEALKVNEARNQSLQAKGKVEMFDHTKKLIGKPLTSSDLQERAKLHTEMLSKEAQYEQQVFSSGKNSLISILNATPAGDMVNMSMFTFNAMQQTDWSKFSSFQSQYGPTI